MSEFRAFGRFQVIKFVLNSLISLKMFLSKGRYHLLMVHTFLVEWGLC